MWNNDPAFQMEHSVVPRSESVVYVSPRAGISVDPQYVWNNNLFHFQFYSHDNFGVSDMLSGSGGPMGRGTHLENKTERERDGEERNSSSANSLLGRIRLTSRLSHPLKYSTFTFIFLFAT